MAYGVDMGSADVDPSTGHVAHLTPITLYGRRTRAVASMNGAFRQLAYMYGIAGKEYALCQEVLHPDDRTYLLVSVVRHKPGTWVPIEQRPSDPMDWFMPDPKTDIVIEWLVIDRALVDDDKFDANLLAAAVQATLERRTAPDYWSVSKEWNEGKIYDVMSLSRQREARVLKEGAVYLSTVY